MEEKQEINQKEFREVKIGQHVIFNEGEGLNKKDRDALVTAIHSPDCINVVCISMDVESVDCNGRIPGDAFTSVLYAGDITGSYYWRFSDQTPINLGNVDTKELVEELSARGETNSDNISASEAIFGFAAWLTTRQEKTIMSSKDDAAPIVELINTFCKINKLSPPCDGYEENLTHPKNWG